MSKTDLLIFVAALSLTSQQLANDPTAASTNEQHHNDASLQLLPESSLAPSSVAPENSDVGRRRRRLGRKRKRRPLQDDYWPPEGQDNDTEANPGGGGGGRLSDRKRLPYAGAAASRWEGISKPLPLPTRARPDQPYRSGHHHRANDWMNNPYTDAINVEQQQPLAGTRRPPYVAPAVGGNFSPIDPNRLRRIPSNAVRGASESPAATAVPTSASNHKAYRKPYSQARRSEEQFSSPDGSGEASAGKPTSATDLKALLKQSDGLSLSEILQQRNISLQDLIKGKQMALAALTQSPLDVTTSMGEQDSDTTTVSPTLSSVRFRVFDDTPVIMTTTTTTTTTPASTVANEHSSSGPESTVNPVRPETTLLLAEDETNNSVDELDGGHAVSIFPTVEIKQLALNPVLPILKEERLRPIKGVASRIRPDLSNAHIRTLEPARFPTAGGNGKRLPSLSSSSSSGDDNAITTATGSTTMVPSNPTVPSLLLITSTAREKWTPSASLQGQRHREQKWSGATGNGKQTSSTLSPPVTSSEPSTAKEFIGRLNSAEATSMLPEAEAMVELSPERHHHHLLRVPKLKTRIAIKPKLTNVVPPTAPSTSTTTTTTTTTSSPSTEGDRLNLSDVELGDDGPRVNKTDISQPRRQQRLNDNDDDEPELNIIEKFTSFAEPSGSLEGKTVTSGETQEDQEMADLIGRISEHTQRSFTDSLEEFYRDVTESNPSLFNDLSPIASSDDRRELLELMEDRRIGSRLAKVLSQRNMTLEQLLEHRRRGSSQLHLAEIVNGKVKPIDDKIDIVTAFEHFPRFNIGNLRSIRPDDIKLDSQGFSYFTSIINLRPSDDVYKEARALQARHRGSAATTSNGNHRNEAHFLASGGSKDRLLVPSRMSATSANAGSYGSNYEEESARENIVEHDLLDLELSGHGFQHHRSASVTIESTSIPVGVRSAIVASSAIVGVSLAIFVAIFVTCRLRQRRRQKLNYTENFNMAKGRLPIIHSAEMEARKSTSSTSASRRSSNAGEQVVYTTHRALGGGGGGGSSQTTDAGTRGRQQSAMMDPNSVDVQDYLWDRKPFQ
ncbi:AGAP013249-PA-like protein [Anopheles sinensis]|uniref:AGAP013249-PA-like protein n=1 Tax=Anopheles sinensis TaxID=74873 RepID=A0A084VHB8_ANOSI|nr:AGAP013249-PA-like protein [Anopheles sinensis]